MGRGEAVLSFFKSGGAVPPLFEKWRGGRPPCPPSISATVLASVSYKDMNGLKAAGIS